MYGCCNFDTNRLYDLIIVGANPHAWGAAAASQMCNLKTLVVGPGLPTSRHLDESEAEEMGPQADLRKKRHRIEQQATEQALNIPSFTRKLSAWYRRPGWELFRESDWISVLNGIPEIAARYTLRINGELYHGLHLLITGTEKNSDTVEMADSTVTAPLTGLEIMEIQTDSEGYIEVNSQFETDVLDVYAAGRAAGDRTTPEEGIRQGITIVKRIVTNHQQNSYV